MKKIEKLLAQNSSEDEDVNKSRRRYRNTPKLVFEVKNDVLVLENLDLNPELILGILIKFPFETTCGFSINQCRAKEEHLIFLLEAYSISVKAL